MIESCKPSDSYGIGPFHFLGRLGHGGFGTVYLAHRHDKPDALVAVKVLSPDRTGPDAAIGDFAARFAREVSAIRLVTSAYVPGFVDAGPHENPPWLATELVRGLSLRSLVQRDEGWPEQLAWSIGAEIVAALKAIWSVGLYHRDLTPANTLLGRQGLKVVDFGLARYAGLPHTTSSRRLPLGNQDYAPPEQLQHPLAEVTHPKAADIYMLGGTLLFAATGHPPHFPDDSARHGFLNLERLPGDLFEVIRPCLYLDPTARPSLETLEAAFGSRHRPTADLAGLLPPSSLSRLADFERDLEKLASACDGLGRGAGSGKQYAATPRRPHRQQSSYEAEPDTQPEKGTSPLPDPAWAEPFARPARPASGTLPLEVPTSPGPDPGRFQRPRLLGTGLARPPRDSTRRNSSAANIRWTQQFGAWVSASVTLVGESVIAADVEGTLACLRAQDGEPIWEIPVGAPVRSSALVLHPHRSGVGTRVCVGDDDGGVHAVDVATRHQKVLFRADGAIQGSPVLLGNRVYAVSDDGIVHAYDLDESIHSEFYRADRVSLGPPVTAGALLVMGDSAGQIFAVSTMTGQPAWSVQTAGRLLGLPHSVSDTIYAAATDGLLRAISTHGVRRTLLRLGAPVHVAPVHDDDLLYIGSCDGAVHAFQLPTEAGAEVTPLWQRSAGDEIRGLTAAGGRLFVSSGDAVRTFNASGQPGPAFQMEGLTAAEPAVSDAGLLYVAGLGGRICCASLS